MYLLCSVNLVIIVSDLVQFWSTYCVSLSQDQIRMAAGFVGDQKYLVQKKYKMFLYSPQAYHVKITLQMPQIVQYFVLPRWELLYKCNKLSIFALILVIVVSEWVLWQIMVVYLIRVLGYTNSTSATDTSYSRLQYYKLQNHILNNENMPHIQLRKYDRSIHPRDINVAAQYGDNHFRET